MYSLLVSKDAESRFYSEFPTMLVVAEISKARAYLFDVVQLFGCVFHIYFRDI